MRKRIALCAGAFLLGSFSGTLLAQIDPAVTTITAGGTAQQVFPADPNRAYLFCENPITATETLFINAPNPAGLANGSYEIAPGGSLNFDHFFVPRGAVSAYAATTGHRFICKRG